MCGTGAAASGQNATAQGNGAVANGDNTMALGTNTRASFAGSVAIGNGAQANADPTTAVGSNAIANGNNSVALGANTTANGSNSVALGQGSVANRANSVSVGDASTGLARQITNVAPGTQGTDAVNLSQLQATVSEMKDRIDETGAISEAASQIQLPPGDVQGVGVGLGGQGSQAALAVGFVGEVRSNMLAKLTVGVSRNTTNIGAGLTLGW